MVKSIKYWMITSNLIKMDQKNKSYELTELGKLIANYDLYLEDIFTLWIIHLNIVRNFKNATSWNLFFNNFNATDFSTEDVKIFLKQYVEQNDIKCTEKSLESDINVLLSMYSKSNISNDPEENFSCPLERLKLLQTNRNMYSKQIPNLNDMNELVVLYAILLMTENNNTNYISISDLEHSNNSLANLLYLNRVLINEYLEQLSSLGFLRVEKTAGLDMVYITTNLRSDEIVKLYFEGRDNLC